MFSVRKFEVLDCNASKKVKNLFLKIHLKRSSIWRHLTCNSATLSYALLTQDGALPISSKND